MTRIKTLSLAAMVVVGIFGGIGISAAAGLWKTENAKEPAKIRSGEFAGLPSPSDIRGSYTWADVSKAFGIPVARLLEAFGAASGADKVNALEAAFGGKTPEGSEIGTDSVRLFAALYTGLPHSPEADTILPVAAIKVLREEGKAPAARIDEAASRAFDPAAGGAEAPAQAPAPQSASPNAPKASAPAPAASPATAAPAQAPPAAAAQQGAEPAVAEHATTPGSVTGKTTFADLTSWGLDMGKVEALLGGLGPSSQAVKDYCSEKGLSFAELKGKLQELAK